MDKKHSNHTSLSSALDSVRKMADQILSCPACQSNQIYTTLNMAYYYDHVAGQFSLNSSMNLAEHGWHGCRRCDHKWVSNEMLQTALIPKTPPVNKNNVIELTHLKKKFK